jgi:hypothetical protein
VDLHRIFSDLKAERDRIARAIAVLKGTASTSSDRSIGRPRGSRRGGGMTQEGRRRVSLAMKKCWAGRRKKVALKAKAIPLRAGVDLKCRDTSDASVLQQ